MTISANTTLSRIMQIAVNIHDADRATAFYQDVLGLKLLFRAGELSFFDCGGTRLMLTKPPEARFDHPGSILYFEVSDLHATFARLQSAGVTFEDQPHMIARMPSHEVWMTVFHDSEDNVLAIMSEIPNAA